MTWITFTEDVRPEGDESAAPLYKKGDSHDVSEGEAQRCVRAGIAELGRTVLCTPRSPEEVAEFVRENKIKPFKRSIDEKDRPRSSKPFAKKQTDKASDD